jgi:hypothetical protein
MIRERLNRSTSMTPFRWSLAMMSATALALVNPSIFAIALLVGQTLPARGIGDDVIDPLLSWR